MRPQSQNQDLCLLGEHLRGLYLSNHVTENHSDKVLPEHMGEDATLPAHQILTPFNLPYGNNCLQGQCSPGSAAVTDKTLSLQLPLQTSSDLSLRASGCPGVRRDDTTKGPRWSLPTLPPFLHV